MKGILNRLKLAKLNFSQNFLVTAFDVFTIFHQKTPFDFMNKDSQIKIKVFKMIIKNPNNARNLENIILISLGINFIKGF